MPGIAHEQAHASMNNNPERDCWRFTGNNLIFENVFLILSQMLPKKTKHLIRY